MEQYNLAAKKWMQAHSCGAFVIMKVLYEAGEGLLTFEEVKKDENDYFIIKLDRYFLLFHSYAFIFQNKDQNCWFGGNESIFKKIANL